MHYRGSQCKYCVGGGGHEVLYFKRDKLDILNKYDLESMSWSVILDLIGEDKLPSEFKQLCKFGENTPERKKMIQNLIDSYDIDVPEEESKIEDNDLDNNIENKVNTIDDIENDIYDDSDDELKPYKEIKNIGEVLENDTDDIYSAGDKWIHIVSKEIGRLWSCVLRDNENHNENTINEIHQKLINNSLTKFEKYIYEEFIKEYDEVVNLEIH